MQPPEEELRSKILDLSNQVNLETTGLKEFMALLSQSMGGTNLKPHKKFIKECVVKAIQDKQQQQEDDEEDDDDEDDEEEEEEEDVRTPPSSKGPKKKGSGGGLSAPKALSGALAAFLGLSHPAELARTEVVKRLWDYIRKHELQNPNNKREINLDADMQAVFDCSTFTMFTMNKYVSAHMAPFTPVNLDTPSTNSGRKRKRAAASSNTPKGKRSKGSATKKTPRNAPQYRLSEALQAVVGGATVLSRPQVVSKLWEYIKAEELQNPSDKRQILCNPPLQKVMDGKSKVTMFSMNQYLSPHLLERVQGTASREGEEEPVPEDGDEDDDSDE